MAVQLYNEGRVVGLSAYEIYVKHAYAEDPDHPPATEKEWLASTIAMGSSMILKIPAGTPAGPKDFPLPSNTRLIAANVVIGSFFYGDCEFDSQGWATKVTDYGELISNVRGNSPTNDNVPVKSSSGQNTKLEEMMQYIKIVDGIIYQRGDWQQRSDNNPVPYKSMILDLRNYPTPVVRLKFSDTVSKDTCLMLTGFTNSIVVQGVTGLDDCCTSASSPQDGDFLGPAVMPWSAKIIFSQPATLTYYLRDGIKSGSENVIITKNPNTTDVTIEVKNNIHPAESSQDYLKITQIKDGSDTSIAIEPKKLVSRGLTCGTGIALSESDDKVLIRSDLKSGPGISISPPSGNLPIAQTISAKLKAGAGIKIVEGNNSELQIINSAPYPGSVAGYVQLTKGIDYEVTFHNNYGSYLDDSTIDSDDLIHRPEADGGDDVRVRILPSLDSNNNLEICYIDIRGSIGDNYCIGNPCFTSNEQKDLVMLKHTIEHTIPQGDSNWSTLLKSRIFSIKFINTKYDYKSTTIDLTQLNHPNTKFQDNGESGMNIWNLRGIARGAWPVYCSLVHNSGNYPVFEDGHSLMLFAGSIADGYNQQFSTLFENAGATGKGDRLFSKHLNINYGGMFYNIHKAGGM